MSNKSKQNNIPDGWQKDRLGDVCDIKMGQWTCPKNVDS